MTAGGRNALKMALVTVPGGIGFEVARQLAQGARRSSSPRNKSKTVAAARELTGEGLHVHPRPIDAPKTRAWRGSPPNSTESSAKLDVLVTHAAYADWLETTSTADLKASCEVLDTNPYGVWSVCHAFLPLIRRNEHGRIINVSSGAGPHGKPRSGMAAGGGAVASYGISKAALNALTAKLATKLADTGILINSIDPGLTATTPGSFRRRAYRRLLPRRGATPLVSTPTLAEFLRRKS